MKLTYYLFIFLVRKKRSREITVTCIRQQCVMVLASIFGPLGGLERSPNRSTGRDASQNAFGLTKPLTIARGRPMITEPGFHFPLAAASSIMAFAIRSLMLPAGLKYSSLPSWLASSPSLCSIGTRFRGGVFPINWSQI